MYNNAESIMSVKNDELEIDMREYIDQLTPFINGCGGVVHIEGSENSAVDRFVNRVRLMLCPQKSNSIKIDCSDSETRYETGICDILSKRLNVNHDVKSSEITTHVGNNIWSFGKVKVKNIVSLNNSQSVYRISSALHAYVQKNSFWVFIYMNGKASYETLLFLHEQVLGSEFYPLSSSKLVLVIVYPPSYDECLPSELRSDKIIQMKERFENGNLEDAIIDISGILVDIGFDEKIAKDKARRLIERAAYSVPRTINRVARLRVTL